VGREAQNIKYLFSVFDVEKLLHSKGCGSGSWKRKRWKRLNFCGSGITLKKEAGSELGSIFHKTWDRDVEAEAVEVVKFLWNRKHFEERSWKRKKTRKQLTLYGAGSESINILLLLHSCSFN